MCLTDLLKASADLGGFVVCFIISETDKLQWIVPTVLTNGHSLKLLTALLGVREAVPSSLVGLLLT